MTTKEKYELIDKTKINEKILTILRNMEQSSSNFTDEAVNSKIDGALEKLIEQIRANKPEALRTLPEAKKEVKKEKEKAIKKNEGKDFSDKKDTDDKTGLPKKDTLEERKDIIKEESETEKEARDRAKKELEKEKEQAKDEVESQIEKLNRIIMEDPALRGFNQGSSALGGKGLGGKSNPLIDAERKALPRGSRVSQKGWKNQYGASDGGRKYYENRENRTDRKSPDYETGKPYLEKGGNVYSFDERMNIAIAYNYAKDRGVDSDKSFEEFKEEFRRKTPKSAKYSDKVMKATYYALQQNYAKGGNIDSLDERIDYDESGKEYFFADGGETDGELYIAYENTFKRFDSDVPVPMEDFEKLLHAYQKQLSGDKLDVVKYEVLKGQMGNYLGHKTVEEMEAYFVQRRNSYKMADGGEVEGVDLFEDYDDQPEEVQVILANYEMEDNDYETLQNLKAELESIGYTMEFGLDAEPYDLRKIGEKGKSEFYAKGGTIKTNPIINQYKGRLYDDIWNNWTENQRYNFIEAYKLQIEKRIDYKRDIYSNELPKRLKSEFIRTAYGSTWKDLDESVKNIFMRHVNKGQFAEGGEMADGGEVKGGSHFKIGDVVELKTIPENLPYEIRKGIIDNKWEITRVSKSGRSMYSDIMEDVFGYDIELLDKKVKYKMFVYPEDVIMKYAKGGMMADGGETTKSGKVKNLEDAKKWVSDRIKYNKVVAHKKNVYYFIQSSMKNPKFPPVVATYFNDQNLDENIFIESGYANGGYMSDGIMMADGGYVNQYFGKGYEDDAITELKKALPNHKFEKGKNKIIVDGGKYIIYTDEGRNGIIRIYDNGEFSGGIGVERLSEAIEVIKKENLYDIGGIMANGGRKMADGSETDGKYTEYEMVVLSKNADGKSYKYRFLISARNIDEAKQIATDGWNSEFGDMGETFDKVMTDSKYRMDYGMADGGALNGNLYRVGYLKVYENDEEGDTVYTKEIYGDSEEDVSSKFKKIHPKHKIEFISKYADGGMMADGGEIRVGDTIYRAWFTDDDGEKHSRLIKADSQEEAEIKAEKISNEHERYSYVSNPIQIKNSQQLFEETNMAKGGMMTDGGEVDFEERMAKMRNAYENLNMIVKSRIAVAIGIDRAISIMERDYSIDPFGLITSAVRSGLLELDEINKDLVNEAVYEAERVTDDYRDSGQGIGGSDMTYFTKNVLDSAGYKTGFVNNRLTRVDADGNELVIDKYEMNY